MASSYTPKQQAVATDKKGTVYLLTPISKRMLQHLAKHGEVTYSHMSRYLHVPIDTLMVYAQRLNECGLIDREQKLAEHNSRITTFLSLKVTLTFDIKTIKV